MTAFTIIVCLAIAIAGYCIGYYAGAESTAKRITDFMQQFINHDNDNSNKGD